MAKNRHEWDMYGRGDYAELRTSAEGIRMAFYKRIMGGEDEGEGMEQALSRSVSNSKTEEHKSME